jgi:hypothetical protein
VSMPDKSAAPAILLLGTGHWSNPGKDYKTVEFDDMLAPARQREIAVTLERLVVFAPTKVALEIMPEQADAWNEEYRSFRDGRFRLTADERHQLGFRLAAMLGHERIHGVDWHDLSRPIGWDRAIAYAREHDQLDRIPFFTQLEQETDADRAAERERLRRMSVRDQLLETNDPARMAESHRVYMDLAQIGHEGENVGAEVVLRWYERNIMIFANIARLAMTSADRVLVVIGGGHLPLLAHFIDGAGRFDLVPARRYLA